jgi:hypothetical protein
MSNLWKETYFASVDSNSSKAKSMMATSISRYLRYLP